MEHANLVFNDALGHLNMCQFLKEDYLREARRKARPKHLVRILMRFLERRNRLFREVRNQQKLSVFYRSNNMDTVSWYVQRIEATYQACVSEMYNENPDFVRGFATALVNK